MGRRLLRSWLWKPSVDKEVEGELAFHLEMRTREYVARGLPRETARQAALRRFGNVGLADRTCRRLARERDRQMRRREYLAELRQDAVFGVRQLWKNPGFTSVAILTLALGIGATTAIFSTVQAVVLRPLPYHEPHRLVQLFEAWRDLNRGGVSVGNFTEWSRRQTVVDDIAAISWGSFNLTEGPTPERVLGAEVTGRFFDVFGVAPLLGRTLGEQDDRPGRQDVVVLSHRLWMRVFGGDASIVGREVRLSGGAHTVIGVMPASFDITLQSEVLWVPAAFTSEEKTNFDEHYLTVIGRLESGVTIDQARAHVSTLARQLEREQPIHNAGRGVAVEPRAEIFVGGYRQRLFVLLGAVGFVLLIACGNVANLLLARGAIRSTEIAVRSALGAGRGRLVRQLLTESVLLAGLGGVAGLVLAYVGLRTLVALSPPGVPRLDQAHLDSTTLAFTALVAVTSSIVFGLAPAWRATRLGVQDTLRSGRSGGMGTPRDRLRSVLVIAEVTLAVLLLVGSGLLIRTAIALAAVDPGFDPRGVLSARVALPEEGYQDDARMVRALEDMVDEARVIPAVTSAAVVSQVPLGSGGSSNGLIPEGRPMRPESAILSQFRLVSPAYFETMRIPIKEGRGFSDQDRRGVQKVMIISETLARQAWPNEPAIGKRITCCEPGPGGILDPDFKIVVGVAADVRWSGPGQLPAPEFYLPIAQAPATPPGAAWDWIQRTMYLVVRTPQDPATLAGSVARALHRVDPDLPLFDIRTMEQRGAEAVATSRFNTVLLTTLGAIGLVLAAVGIYGVIAYFVSQRTQEIGVRVALGASPTNVIRLVVRQALKPVLLGLMIGVGGAVATSGLLAAQLYGVTPRDPITITLVGVTFVLVAILASWAPARHAARLDPTRALNTAQ